MGSLVPPVWRNHCHQIPNFITALTSGWFAIVAIQREKVSKSITSFNELRSPHDHLIAYKFTKYQIVHQILLRSKLVVRICEVLEKAHVEVVYIRLHDFRHVFDLRTLTVLHEEICDGMHKLLHRYGPFTFVMCHRLFVLSVP